MSHCQRSAIACVAATHPVCDDTIQSGYMIATKLFAFRVS